MSPGDPWQGDWHRHRHWGNGPPPWVWRRRRGRLFLGFILTFGLMALLLAGAVSTLTFMITRLVGGGHPGSVFGLAGGWALVVLLVVLVVRLGRRASRRITTPLAAVMQAADAVASGDLTVRLPVYGPGEFGQLAASFNHMAAELERSDALRRNLTADVAHELRTPLHIIQGNLEGILDGVYRPTPEHVQATLDETRALARLVEDLRTLSLAEAGQLPLAQEQVNVGELLADAATSFSGQAEAAGLDLRVETPGDDQRLIVEGDAGRLDQVVSNLLANALRHTPRGGRITLRAEAVPAAPLSGGPPGSDGKNLDAAWGGPPAGAGVRISVADTGEGISADDLPYIFERFWRGDRSQESRQAAGSGLGLAIARQLVQAHGGRISAASRPGEGTVFMVDLPGAPRSARPESG